MSGRDPIEALMKKDGAASRKLKKTADAAIDSPSATMSEGDVKKVDAAVKRANAREKKRQEEQGEQLWYDATKIIVPAYWGNHGAIAGLKLAKTLSPAGVLALILAGIRTDKGPAVSGDHGVCEVSMQMALRPSGFDRQEARELAAQGFADMKALKFLKQTKKPEPNFDFGYYLLSAKGAKAYDIIRRSATAKR